MWRYKKRELLYWGRDYLYANIDNLPDIFYKLSPNSNYLNLENWFYLQRDFEKSPKNKIIINIFNSQFPWVSIWFFIIYLKYIKNEIKEIDENWELKIKTQIDFLQNQNEIIKPKIELTGQGLTLFWIEKLYNELIIKLKIKLLNIIRLDVCLDLSFSVDKMIELFEKKWKLEKPTRVFNDNKWNLETYYIGKKEKSNKYQLIRFYDKKKDSKIKSKTWLYKSVYWDEFDYNNSSITRLELEIREQKAKFITVEKLLDDNYIFSIFVKTFFKYNYDFFSCFKYEDFYKNKQKIKNTTQNLSSFDIEFEEIEFKKEKIKENLIKLLKSSFQKWLNDDFYEELKTLIDNRK